MNKIKKLHIISLVLTILLGIGLTLISRQTTVKQVGQYLEKTKNISYVQSLTNEKKLNTNLKFISGELVIFPETSTANLFTFQAEYKLIQHQPKISYTHNLNAYLDIGLNRYQYYGLSSRSNWSLGLNCLVTHNLNIESKAFKQALDLSGLSLENFILKTRAGFINIQFNQQNPIIMKQFLLETGPANCHISGLSYANAQKITLRSNAGNFVLDFTGKQETSCDFQIFGKIGNTQILLPKNLNAKIIINRNLLTANTISGLRKISANTFISQNYQENLPKLTIYVNLRTGKLTIEAK